MEREDNMVDIRCDFCGNLLMKSDLCYGEIMCRKCKTVNKINVANSRGIDRIIKSEIIKRETLSPRHFSGFFNKKG